MSIFSASEWSDFVEEIGDVEVAREILEAYGVETREHLARLPETIAAGDAPEVRRRAHSVKGAMRFFVTQEAMERALALEELAAGGGLEGADALLDEVRAAVEPVLAQLDRFLERVAADA